MLMDMQDKILLHHQYNRQTLKSQCWCQQICKELGPLLMLTSCITRLTILVKWKCFNGIANFCDSFDRWHTISREKEKKLLMTKIRVLNIDQECVKHTQVASSCMLCALQMEVTFMVHANIHSEISQNLGFNCVDRDCW